MEQNAGASRRRFMQATLIGGAGLTLGGTSPAMATPSSESARHGSTPVDPGGTVDGSSGYDFTRGSAALTPDSVVTSACQFCNANCRIHVSLKANRIINVRGESDDPVQNGNICVKASMMPELVYHPLRLTTPLKRVSGAKGATDSKFAPVSWDEALDIVARRLLKLRDEGEARAVANRATGRLPQGVGTLAGRLFTLLGSPNHTDVGPVCNDAGGDALRATFGLGNFTNGYGKDGATGREDLGSARYFLFLGTNQAETHPVTFDYLLRSREQTHAKLVVVDPRRTATGELADTWIAPKPHTDLALVLALLHHVVLTDRYDHDFVERWVLGFAELRDHLVRIGCGPEWAETITGVPATTIREIAEEYAAAKPAAIFCNAGISHQLGAFDTYRVLAFLAAVTGNVGVLGGGCNFMHNTWPGHLHLPPLTVRTPDLGPALPVGPDYFAESILTGKPYRLRAVITEGNPLVSSANTSRVKEAFRKLDFFVYTGLFMEEAAYYADVILPVCSALEFDGVYMRRDDRAVRWQHAVTDRVGEARPDWEIWIELAHAMARNDRRNPASYWTDAFPEAWKDYRSLWTEFVNHTPGMKGMTAERLESRVEPLRWPCPTTDHPGVSALFTGDASWQEAVKSLGHDGKRFLTPSGKVEIHTADLEERLATTGHAALPRFYTHPEVTGRHPTITYTRQFVTNPVNPQALTPKVEIGAQTTGDVHREYPLMGTTGRPSVVHFATVTHWTLTGKQLNGVRLIQIHPRTGARQGIRSGDAIVVESPRGSVVGTALLWDGIRKDTIFVPNGFGPAQRIGDIFHDPRYDATNTLIDDRYFDNLSGQQAYKCFACRIRRA